MHTLSKERWLVVSPHLDRALELDAEQRAIWLASLRAEDAALAADLQVLLQDHDILRAEGFLTGDARPLLPQASLAGLVIGPFTLRSLLGQGGMGNVWLADRTDGHFTGQAAVKLLNASLIGAEGEARFKREGRLLALLRHPHIAQIIDAGLSSLGQPYLILEYIDGERIDQYCDAKSLGIEARIRLFLDVLAAVAHAHANLVVHRDLKPQNILVASDGQVKLLDFGIAKLLETEPGAGQATALTREGQAVMTPEYASPEQLTGGHITTATDIYSLGVVLYVLLTGQHPAGANIKTPADLIKAVVDSQALRLSDAVVTANPITEEQLVDAAAKRSTVAAKLRRQLQGDLDNIVALTLKKQPGERYLSVEALADDLRRYLGNQPVSARADSLGYRAAKYVRRNRVSVAVGALVIVAALAGTTAIAWQAREVQRQRDAAQTQLTRSNATNEFMAFLLSVAAPGGKKFNVSDLLEQGELLIDKQFSGDDALRAEMMFFVGNQYRLSGRWDKAGPVLERAAEIASRSADPTLKARALCPLAVAKLMTEDRPGAETMMAEALADLPREPRNNLLRAECLIRFSEFGFFTDEAQPMILNASKAIELLDASPVATTSMRIEAESALAYGYYLARQNQKAEQGFASVMRALEQIGRDQTVAAADTLNNWGLVYYLGDIAKAEPLFRREIDLRRSIEGAGAVEPTATYNLAGVLLQLGRYSEAEALFEETIRTAAVRQEWRIELDATMELAELFLDSGDLPRATSQLGKVTPFLKGPRFTPMKQAQLAYYKGRLSQARGDHVSARTQLTQAIDIFESRKGKIAMNVLALIGLARSDLALGDQAAAMTSAGHAITLAESFVEKDAPSYLVGLSQSMLGEIHLANGRKDEAHAAFRTALEHLQKTLGPGHPATISARRNSSS